MNVLVDYTNSPQIKEFVKQIASNKFQRFDLEVLLGGNQVIPPSATKCKKTLQIGQPRAFKSGNVFYVIKNEEGFVFDFIKALFVEKLEKTNFKPIQRIIANPSPTTIVNQPCEQSTIQTDKYLDLLFNVIGNGYDDKNHKKISRDYWFQIVGILKYNGYSKQIWLNYSGLVSKTNTASKVWDGIKNNRAMSIYGLQNIAKEINPEGYKQWLSKWDIYYINSSDLDDPYKVAEIIHKTLKNTLVLCKENWFMLTENQLWNQAKEPSYYIVNELRKYIDESNKKLVYKISQSEGEQKEKLIEQSKLYLKSYKTISNSGFLNVLTKFLKTLLVDNKFEDKLDANIGELAFQNGIMDLETKQFRHRICSDDYLTKTIPYDYNKGDAIKKQFVKNVLKQILNNNEEHLEYLLSIVGFTFIGSPHLEKSIYFCVDKTEKASGDNGKTFFFDILSELLPNYVYKSKGSLLEEGNTKVHKQLVMMKGKRLVWIDEFGKKKSNAELMKEIGDGLGIENEILFGTSEIINIMFKLFTLTNNMPLIDPKDTAVYNRYKQISYGSHFDRTGTRAVAIPEELKFIADATLGDIIKTEYYNEVFELIIEYANKYYTNKIPKIPSQFIKDTKETQNNNDTFGLWFSENCVIDESERTALKAIVAKSGMNEKIVKEGLVRCGFKYDKDLRKLGKNESGEAYKGGYVGFKLTEDIDDVDEE
jgi:phage/plasmid-associated DNA primase